MRVSTLALLSALTLGGGCAMADAPAAPAHLSADSSVDQILDALHDRGVGLKDFTATVTLSDIDNGSGDATVHSGALALEKKSEEDARFKLALTKVDNGTTSSPENHVYILDNGTLTERNYLKKSEVDREVAKPGQKINLLKLGEGPFPLPVGQDKEEVKRQFDVTKVAPAKDDPPGTVHVLLTPKKGTRFARQFKKIDVWVDEQNDMPRRISTVDPNEATTRQTDLTDLKTNVGLTDEDFRFPDAPTKDWDVVKEAYGD